MFNDDIETFDKAIELVPNYSNAWDHKGNALYQLNRSEEAIEVFKKAIEFNPGNTYAKQDLEFALRKLNK